jgi:hypothetical protein
LVDIGKSTTSFALSISLLFVFNKFPENIGFYLENKRWQLEKLAEKHEGFCLPHEVVPGIIEGLCARFSVLFML